MNDIPEILEGLRHAPAILRGLAAQIPAPLLERKRGEGCWSIAEHILHLAQVQPMFYERLRRIIDEEQAEIVPFFPEKDESAAPQREKSVDKALELFAEQRMLQVKMLESTTPKTWGKTAVHHEFELYGIYILARHILMHDHWHMYRMEELWLTKDAYFTA